MGKAANWFRSLLSSKKPPKNHRASNSPFSNSSSTSIKFRNTLQDPLASPYADGLDANKHAIAVAAATAAVAEAALAAAQAAAEVVRLTSGGGSGRSAPDLRPVAAAVRIQSAFRAYLARRALRALKGLVKLQALVRGHIVRKQSADMLRRMQAMARIQARASAHRCYTTEYPNTRMKFNNAHHPANTNVRKTEGRSYNAKGGGSHLKPQQSHLRSPMDNGHSKGSSQIASRWLNHWIDDYSWNNNINDACLENGIVDDGRSDKILEIDTWKPRQNTNRSSKAAPVSQYFSAWNDRNSRLSSKPNPSISSEDVSSIISSKVPPEGDQVPAWTVENSPRVNSASSRPGSNLRGGTFSPARSECSRSFFGDYLGHPSYMANTESSRAKARSLSAPKQRMSIEDIKFGPSLWELDAVSEKGSALSSNHRSNGYLYNGQLKRQGTPTRHDLGLGYSSLSAYRH